MFTDFAVILLLWTLSVVLGGIAAILYIIAGFQESKWWGLAMFIPFGNVVFTIFHWDHSKKPFVLSLLCVLFLVGAFAMGGDTLLGLDPVFSGSVKKHSSPPETVESLTAELNRLREQEAALAGALASKRAALRLIYEDLTERRAMLPEDNPEEIQQFNKEAAIYTEENRKLGLAVSELAALRGKIAGVLDRRKHAAARAGSSDQRVITLYMKTGDKSSELVKAHLQMRGVLFEEVDIEKSPAGSDRFHALGGDVVPVVFINGQPVHGFKPEEIDKLLN